LKFYQSYHILVNFWWCQNYADNVISQRHD